MEEKVSTNKVDILILFFNKVDQTINCISSFLPSGQQIYVLNNGSDEQQIKKLREVFRNNNNVHLLDGGCNLGVSGGRNFLIRHTNSPWILSVDNDITIKPVNTWLQTFKEYLQKHPGTTILTPRMFNVHENNYSDQLQIKLVDDKLTIESGNYAITNCFPGGASFISRSVFEEYGLFDEGMFVGFEDYEFAVRALLSGKGELKVHSTDDIELVHDHQYQKNSKDKEAVKLRYNEERIAASYNRMVEKFGIRFDHDWEWWTNKQMKEMTEHPFISRVKSIVNRIRTKL